jgi:hypothetical protein
MIGGGCPRCGFAPVPSPSAWGRGSWGGGCGWGSRGGARGPAPPCGASGAVRGGFRAPAGRGPRGGRVVSVGVVWWGLARPRPYRPPLVALRRVADGVDGVDGGFGIPLRRGMGLPLLVGLADCEEWGGARGVSPIKAPGARTDVPYREPTEERSRRWNEGYP